MRDRLSDIVLRTLPKAIDAAIFNHARLALLRLGPPVRVALPDHRGLEVIIDADLWLCIDANAEDQPILAWRNFPEHRDNLHEPVSCRLELYHPCAGLVMGSALDDVGTALDLLLHTGEHHH